MEQIIAALLAFFASLPGGIGTMSSQAVQNIAPAAAHAAPSTNTAISAQRAFDIAVAHARVAPAAAFDRSIELEREFGGRLVWDVEFETITHEYDYVIDANSGAIIRFDNKRD